MRGKKEGIEGKAKRSKKRTLGRKEGSKEERSRNTARLKAGRIKERKHK